MFILNPSRFASAAGGPLTAHKYWRILFSANAGSPSYDGIGEMEYRATVSGADQTVSGAVGPLASSTINASNQASYAFLNDGGSSGWLSASAGTSWLRYAFPSPVLVREVSITGPNNSITSSPKDFQIQYSDDDTLWATAKTVLGQTGWVAGTPRLFTI